MFCCSFIRLLSCSTLFFNFPVAKFRNGAASLVIVSRDSMICLDGLSEKVTLSSIVWCCVAFASARRFAGGMSPKPMYVPLVTLFCPLSLAVASAPFFLRYLPYLHLDHNTHGLIRQPGNTSCQVVAQDSRTDVSCVGFPMVA